MPPFSSGKSTSLRKRQHIIQPQRSIQVESLPSRAPNGSLRWRAAICRDYPPAFVLFSLQLGSLSNATESKSRLEQRRRRAICQVVPHYDDRPLYRELDGFLRDDPSIARNVLRDDLTSTMRCSKADSDRFFRRQVSIVVASFRRSGCRHCLECQRRVCAKGRHGKVAARWLGTPRVLRLSSPDLHALFTGNDH